MCMHYILRFNLLFVSKSQSIKDRLSPYCSILFRLSATELFWAQNYLWCRSSLQKPLANLQPLLRPLAEAMNLAAL